MFLKIILYNECNFKFTNIEAAKTIISTFKSSIEISLFQWTQVSRHPKCKRRSMHGFQGLTLVLILIFFLLRLVYWNYWNLPFINFWCKENFEWERAKIMVWGGFERITLQLDKIEIKIIFFIQNTKILFFIY